MSNANDNPTRKGQRRAGGVIDPAGSWEDALRAGQREEGDAGSVEAELAVVHLLRHARAPEALDDGRLAALWAGVEHGLADASAAPWWKRPWSWIGGGALAAAAAAVVLVVVLPKGGVQGPEVAQRETAPAVSPAATIERQFALLAPTARQAAAQEVDVSRDALRGNLLAEAVAATADAGGSP